MAELKCEFVVWEESGQLGLTDLARCTGVHPDMIRRLVDLGLLDPIDPSREQAVFGVGAVERLRTMTRLRRDLGCSLGSLGIILDLIERVKVLQHEIDQLRAKL